MTRLSISALKSKELRWPWIVLNIALYTFCIPWMISVIIFRYYVHEDPVLPGHYDDHIRSFFMVGHITLGGVCLICYPMQFSQSIRKKWPEFHRWNGRVSVLCAVLTSVCGLVFICLKRFVLVGGINMGMAFFVAGLVFGGCAIMTGYYAKNRDFVRHRYWAIRSYSQILAPMMYRYWYLVVGGLGLYPEPEYDDVVRAFDCNEDDVCSVFLRAFDAIHAWTYFIVPLIFAELIVYLLKKQEDEKNDVNNEMVPKDVDIEGVDKVIRTEEKGVGEINFLPINLLGLTAASCGVIITAFIYVTSALGTNSASS